jgi:hypothetical protein
MTLAALRKLAALMEARKARDLARLERLLAEDRVLAAELATLACPDAACSASETPLPLRHQAARLAWIDQHKASLRRRRAVLTGEIARARAAAVQSLGRERALDHLAEGASRSDAARRTAREDALGQSGSVAD